MTTSTFAQNVGQRHGIFSDEFFELKILDEAQSAPSASDAVAVGRKAEQSLLVAGGDPRQSMGGSDGRTKEFLEYLRKYPTGIRNPEVKTRTPQQLLQDLAQISPKSLLGARGTPQEQVGLSLSVSFRSLIWDPRWIPLGTPAWDHGDPASKLEKKRPLLCCFS